MAEDHQLPKYFISPDFEISHRSLVFTTFICCLTLLFFKNWQELMLLVSIFQLISCASIPIAFTKLRISNADLKRVYQVKLGNLLSYIIFLVISLFLIKIDLFSLLVALILYIVFFFVYAFSYYHWSINNVFKACGSSGSMFLYLCFICIFGYFNKHEWLENWIILCAFLLLMSLNFWLMINQKNYNSL